MVTDAYGTGPSPDGSDRQRSRASTVTGLTVGFLVFAVLGAVGGYLLAGDPPARRHNVADNRSSEPTVTPGTPTSSPTPEPSSPATTTTTTPATGSKNALTDLGGWDFVRARDELHRQRLGWRLVFLGPHTGTDRQVVRTVPPAGSPVRPGTTVRVEIAGPAPEVRVPDVRTIPCGQAADRLGEVGLYPRYPSGNQGVVIRQDPAPDTTGHWNDQVAIWCGTVPPSIQPSSSPA